MTTFDLAEVSDYAADLEARRVRCDNGEGMECANLDAELLHYTGLCREYLVNCRDWYRGVFSGRLRCEPAVERVWREYGQRLLNGSAEKLRRAEADDGVCYIVSGQSRFADVVRELERFVSNWVTPTLAVAPSARRKLNLTDAEIAEVRRRLDDMPPVPADWQPRDVTLRDRLDSTRASRG